MSADKQETAGKVKPKGKMPQLASVVQGGL
jgi:hypothetical protein